jgi:fatty-acyl-CoA synthase
MVIEGSITGGERAQTMLPEQPSYACGTSDVPLLGDTIGGNFDQMATAQADHEALVEVRTSRRWTYRELAEEVDTVALGLLATGNVRG